MTKTVLTWGQHELLNVLCYGYFESSGSYLPACRSRGPSLIPQKFVWVCDVQSDTGTVFFAVIVIIIIIIIKRIQLQREALIKPLNIVIATQFL